MIKLFNTLKNIYTKQHFTIDNVEKSDIFGLISWLKMDLNNLSVLRKINKFVYYLKPENTLIWLYFAIQQRSRTPFIKYTKKVKKPEISSLYLKIKGYFGWSGRELNSNKKYLDRLDEKQWKKEFGIK